MLRRGLPRSGPSVPARRLHLSAVSSPVGGYFPGSDRCSASDHAITPSALYISDSLGHGFASQAGSSAAACCLCDSSSGLLSTVRDPHGRDLSRFCETTGFADAHGLGRYLPSPIPLIEDLRSKYRPAVPTVCGCWRERNRTGSLRGVALMETYHAGTTCHHVPPTCFTLHEDLLPACYSGTPNFGGKLV